MQNQLMDHVFTSDHHVDGSTLTVWIASFLFKGIKRKSFAGDEAACEISLKLIHMADGEFMLTNARLQKLGRAMFIQKQSYYSLQGVVEMAIETSQVKGSAYGKEKSSPRGN